MKIKNLFLFGLAIALLMFSTTYPQSPEWINYTNGDYVSCLAEEGDYMWVGTTGGLVKINKISGATFFLNKDNSGLPSNRVFSIAIDSSGNKWIGTWYGLARFDGTNWTVYKTYNSGLPSNVIRSIAIDVSGNKWIGTWYGLAHFDGTNWTVYNSSNSGLPNNYIESIAIDGSDNKWIGTWDGGLARFDGTNWTVYNTSNSDLPDDYVNSIAIDGSGNKWIGTNGRGLARFDGTNWTVYNISNSGLPCDYILSIAIDGSGNKWIGTYGDGLARFDGTNWTVYNTSNSVLPNYHVTLIAIDCSGNKWIGTWDGLAVFQEGGVVSIKNMPENIAQKPNKFSLSQNFPNPFNPVTTIRYTVPKTSHVRIEVYDLNGRIVDCLVNGRMRPGEYTVEWNASELSSGIYLYRLQAGDFQQVRKCLIVK